MFALPRPPNDVAGYSKKSASSIFWKRAKNAFDNRKYSSEAEFSKLCENSNDYYEVNEITKVRSLKRTQPKRLCNSCCSRLNDDREFDFNESLKSLTEAEVVHEYDSKATSITEIQSLHTLDEEAKAGKEAAKTCVPINQRLSKLVIHRHNKSKTWASLLKVGATKKKQKSSSEQNVSTLSNNYKTTAHRLPSNRSIRSLEQSGKGCTNSSCSSLLEMIPNDKDIVSLGQCRTSSSLSVAASSTGGNYERIIIEPCSLKKVSSELDNINKEISKCKHDIEEFKSKFFDFKDEVYEGLANLYKQFREDDDRYTKLCYKIDHITDLHQTQIEYLHSLVENHETDNHKTHEKFLFDVLCEKLDTLESRLKRL